MTPDCEARGIDTWQDVQNCINGPFHSERPKLNKTYINLIGERNSGTKWIVEEMQKCFPRETYGIKIERDLWTRNKHFFQTAARSRWKSQQKQVIIAAFRDPVEWVAAM
jgi:hypothetical protein